MVSPPWNTIMLRTDVTLSSGLPVSHDTGSSLLAEIPVYGGNGITGRTTRPLTNRPTFTIGRVGEYCGSVHLVEEDAWVTDNALWATHIAPGWNLHFLVYYLNWLGLGRLRSQTGQPLVTQGEIGQLKLPKPPIGEQRRIMEIFDSLDAQLTSTGRLANKLHLRQIGLTDALLRSVTVQESSLRDYLTQNPKNGYSPQAVDSWTGLLALGLGCLTTSGFRPLQLKNVPVGATRNVSAMLTDGDLLMSRANTRDLVGLVGRYQGVGWPCIYPDLMMRLSPRPTCRAEYLEIVLRSSPLRRQIQSISQGTSESMAKISGSTVGRLRVAVPDLATQDRIARILKCGDAELRDTLKEREKLKSLKHGLMDDLLSGRVRAKDVEDAL